MLNTILAIVKKNDINEKDSIFIKLVYTIAPNFSKIVWNDLLFDSVKDYGNALVDEVLKVKDKNDYLISSATIFLNNNLLYCASYNLKNSSYIELFEKQKSFLEQYLTINCNKNKDRNNLNRELFALQLGHAITGRQDFTCNEKKYANPQALIAEIKYFYDNNLEDYINFYQRNNYFLENYFKLQSELLQNEFKNLCPNIHNFIDSNIGLWHPTIARGPRYYKGITDYIIHQDDLYKNGHLVDYCHNKSFLREFIRNNDNELSSDELEKILDYESKSNNIFYIDKNNVFVNYSQYINYVYKLYTQKKFAEVYYLTKKEVFVLKNFQGNSQLSPCDKEKKLKLSLVFMINEDEAWANVLDYIDYVNSLFLKKEYKKIQDVHERACKVYNNIRNNKDVVNEEMQEEWNKLNTRIWQIYNIDEKIYASYEEYLDYADSLYKKNKLDEVYKIHQLTMGHGRCIKLSTDFQIIETKLSSVCLGNDGIIYPCLEDYLSKIKIQYDALYNSKNYVKLKSLHNQIYFSLSKNIHFNEVLFNKIMNSWISKINKIFIVNDYLVFSSVEEFFKKYLNKEFIQKSRTVQKKEEKKRLGVSYFICKLIGYPTTYQITKEVTENYTVEEYTKNSIDFFGSNREEIEEAFENTPMSLHFYPKIIDLYNKICNSNEKISVLFGNYPQSSIKDNNREPIEWEVLEVEKGKKALLISKYGLVIRKYNDERNKHITWEKSSIRKWLNTDFIKQAFTIDEQNRILKSNVDNGDDNTTKDKIFLLSIDEVNKYISSINNSAPPSNYAKYHSDCFCPHEWWLRTPGKSENTAAVYSHIGRYIEYSRYDQSEEIVRPAIWVNIA